MKENDVYEQFNKAVEEEEFNEFEKAVGNFTLNLADATDKEITFEELRDIVSIVCNNEEITNIIDDAILQELDKILESEEEKDEQI